MVLTSLLSPSATQGKGLVYLECQEDKGIAEETINIHTIGKGGVKSSHNPSTKPMEKSAMRKHMVTLNPEAGTGNWQSDYNPTYYPKHISFSEGDSSDTTILKVSRQKLAEGEVGFVRI